ncbi:MAG: hypothetical protein KGN84_09010 [Acidobacteriota bacterium]|nr:hypothetical protein [Acidobacteriota bacterium]
MSGKSLLIVGVLSLSAAGIASAKTYDVILDQTAKAGTTEIQAGHYALKVQGSQATFKDLSSSKSYTTAVTAATSKSKFNETAVETDKKDGTVLLKEIDLAGSKTRLTFNR